MLLKVLIAAVFVGILGILLVQVMDRIHIDDKIEKWTPKWLTPGRAVIIALVVGIGIILGDIFSF